MKKEEAKKKMFWDVTTCSLARNLPTTRTSTFSYPKAGSSTYLQNSKFLPRRTALYSYVELTDCMIWNNELERMWKEVIIS